MSLQNALLGVLEAQPMTGYDLTQFFASSTNWVWSAPHSQIYLTLRQMERDGLVTGKDKLRGSKLKRTEYTVTKAGVAALRTWTAEVHPSPPSRETILLQALFFDEIAADDAVEILRSYQSEQTEIAEAAEEHSKKLLAKETELIKLRLSQRPADEHQRVAQLKAHVFAGQAAVARARAQWAEEGISLLCLD